MTNIRVITNDGTALQYLVPLRIPVAPMFEAVMGYPYNARWVAFSPVSGDNKLHWADALDSGADVPRDRWEKFRKHPKLGSMWRGGPGANVGQDERWSLMVDRLRRKFYWIRRTDLKAYFESESVKAYADISTDEHYAEVCELLRSAMDSVEDENAIDTLIDWYNEQAGS